jgi:hypothetical protein
MNYDDINKTLSTISKDFEKDLQELDNKSKEINKKTLVIQNYLTNLIKDKCYESFEFLEKNGRIIESDIDFMIKINPKHKTERILSNFHECLDKNDKSIRQLYSYALLDQTNIKQDHILGIKKCLINDKDQLKCFKDTVSDTIYSLNSLYDNLLSDLNNIKI